MVGGMAEKGERKILQSQRRAARTIYPCTVSRDAEAGGEERGRDDVPVLLTEVNAFGEQVRSNGWGVIECHLFEPEARNEESCSDEILSPEHIINTEKRQRYHRKVISRGSLPRNGLGTNLT